MFSSHKTGISFYKLKFFANIRLISFAGGDLFSWQTFLHIMKPELQTWSLVSRVTRCSRNGRRLIWRHRCSRPAKPWVEQTGSRVHHHFCPIAAFHERTTAQVESPSLDGLFKAEGGLGACVEDYLDHVRLSDSREGSNRRMRTRSHPFLAAS